VVRIEGETDYEYFYVLTYLPDLQWCHVGPLEKRGVFAAGSTRGRPGHGRWMLVPEEMGGERDCGASRCHIMEATEVKQTKESADEEEWDVIGLAAPPAPPPAAAPAPANPPELGAELGGWLAAAGQPPPSPAEPPKPAGVLAGIGLKAPPACESASSASSPQPPPPEAMDVV